MVTTLAGSGVASYADGLGTSAIFARPKGIDVTSIGTIYIGDTNNARVRTLTTAGLCDSDCDFFDGLMISIYFLSFDDCKEW